MVDVQSDLLDPVATKAVQPGGAPAAVVDRQGAPRASAGFPEAIRSGPLGVAPPKRNRGYPRQSGYARVKDDWYVEPRWSVHQLLDHENFDGEIFDPCCGGGTIVSVCLERGLRARGSDIVDRGFGEVRDLLSITEPVDNVVSNLPFSKAEPFTRHILGLTRRKAALVLPMPFWESRERNSFFREHPPIRWYPCSDRPSMPPGIKTSTPYVRDRHDAIIHPRASGGTAPYGWWIFERGYRGPTTVCLFDLWQGAKT